MSKKLCKLVNDGFVEDHTKKYTQLVNNPKYVCMKCGRVANDEDSLCRPKKLKDKKESKKSDGFDQISDDIAKEKIEAKIERKVLGQSKKKNTEETFDANVQKRVVKVSKYAIRNKPVQEKQLINQPVNQSDFESSDSDFNEPIGYDENLQNED